MAKNLEVSQSPRCMFLVLGQRSRIEKIDVTKKKKNIVCNMLPNIQ
jgi:hypothetical protein